MMERKYDPLASQEAELAAISAQAQAEFNGAAAALRYHLPSQGLQLWGRRGIELAQETSSTPELAAEYFRGSPQALRTVPLNVFLAWSRLGQELVASSAATALRYFRNGPELVVPVDEGQRIRFLAVMGHLALIVPWSPLAFLQEMSRLMGQMEGTYHGTVLGLAYRLSRTSPPTAVEFLRIAPKLAQRISPEDFEPWYEAGQPSFQRSEMDAMGYFSLTSIEALEALNRLSPAAELSRLRELLTLYCQALSGRQLQLLSTEELTRKGIGWSQVEKPTTDGTAIFLPDRVKDFPNPEENFEVYKVLTAHQSGHLEQGSFAFSLERPSTRFTDLRPPLRQLLGGRGGVSDFEGYFDLFRDRRLAEDVFAVVEDARVDAYLRREYRGIRRTYAKVQERALEPRSPLHQLALQESMLEVLLRSSSGGSTVFPIPGPFYRLMEIAAGLLNLAQSPDTTVEDSAEVSLRLYALLRRLPSYVLAGQPDSSWRLLDLSRPRYNPNAEDIEALLNDFLEANRGETLKPRGQQSQAAEQRTYQSQQELPFRGSFKPELVQALTALREDMAADPAREKQGPVSMEDMERLLQKSVEAEHPPVPTLDAKTITDALMANIVRELGKGWDSNSMPPINTQRRRSRRARRAEAEALLRGEAIPFLYDEWDFRARNYRPRWCTLWQRTLEEGSSDFFEVALAQYRELLSEVRYHFEMLRPSRARRHKRLQDGEEFDLDAVIESLVERRAGTTPSDKIYWRRDKMERDVAVALLLDMSVSTMETIDEGARRLSSSQGDGGRGKRIIDLEKESLVLLTQALELVGDHYGIYGFSGQGRQNVQFFVIKDLSERLSERVKRRIDRIAPVQGTRMAPAIRHATAKLEELEAKTRLLILISDGRPQDQDYGREAVEGRHLWSSMGAGHVRDAVVFQEIMLRREKEYAVHDTRRALLEAKGRGIIPFCISMDRSGHDYLRTMCGDLGYEVVGDIGALPRRLTALYRRLTT